MSNKSVFPSLLLLGLFMVGVSYFSDLFKHNAALEIDDYQSGGYPVTELRKEFQNFTEVTDTALSNNFRIQSELLRTNGSATAASYKHELLKPLTNPVFDTILACYYDDKLLFEERSLKALASEEVDDPDFWMTAGLEYFEVDMTRSADEVVVCSFAFLSMEKRKLREFTLEISKEGLTRITEV